MQIGGTNLGTLDPLNFDATPLKLKATLLHFEATPVKFERNRTEVRLQLH
jgi:hypothetical protein